MVAAPSASLSTSASGPSAASSTTAVGALQQSQPATSSSSSSQQQQPGPAAGGKALVQVDAATVAAARNSQRNSSYITPHTLHSYQAATAAAAGPTSVGGSEPMDAPAGGVATVQPSVMVACRESCRRWVAVPSNVEMNF